MNWYSKGKEGLKKTEVQQKAAELRRAKATSRFFLKAGESARIVFVDDTGFYCNVHQFKVGNSWNNYGTCVKEMKPCPICDSGKNPTWTAHYTVVDMRKFEYNDKVVKNRKVLLPAKGAAIEIIADLKKKYKSLIGRAFEVKRYTAKETNVGTSYVYIGKVSDLVKKFGEDYDKPFDYMTLLAPPTKEEYENWGFAATSSLGEDTPLDEEEEVKEAEFEDELEGEKEEEEKVEPADDVLDERI